MKRIAPWIFLLLIGMAAECFAGQFTWKANSEPDIKGYNLYLYGPSNYSLFTTNTRYRLGQITPGIYSALLTAVNTEGAESDPAGPLTITIPPPTLTLVIEASEDLITWTDTALLQTNIAIDIEPSRFIRARLLLTR